MESNSQVMEAVFVATQRNATDNMMMCPGMDHLMAVAIDTITLKTS